MTQTDELERPRDTLFEIEEKEAKNKDITSWLKNNHSKFSDKSDASGLIKILSDLIGKNGADPESEKAPYYNLFIAYAYSWNNEPMQAEYHAKISELEFLCREKHLQAAISGWLLGLLLFKNGKPEQAQKKIKTLEKNITKWNKDAWVSGHYDNDYFNCLQGKISGSNDWISAHSDGFEQEKKKNNKSCPGSKPLRPADAVNHTSPLQYLIPSYPLYGSVAAGSGEPFLYPTDEILEPVDYGQSLSIRGKNNFVSFFEKQIKAQSGKKYGWLKVVGESMNAAFNIPINNNDYVLFQEIGDLDAYVGKIVIGEIADNETQLAQVVIKRLIKRGEQYFLHSESSLDEDPTTGKKYKQDIEIVRDHQVGGVVIAVAKPVTG